VLFLLTLPFRLVGLGFRLGAGSAKVTHRTVRFVGYRRLFVFSAGVAVGLLIAPVPGDKLRAKLRQAIDDLGIAGAGRSTAPVDVATAVRDELAASPRTWHLPQPAVTVVAGTVTLSGEVPHATAAADLERAARTVRGVLDVDNRLRIATPSN
jgi:BON domain